MFESSAVGLQPADLAAARNVTGGTAPAQVTLQLEAAHARLEAERRWLAVNTQNLPTLTTVTADLP